MNDEQPKSAPPSTRFAKGVPHYHRSNRLEDTEWDEWTGDRVRGGKRQKAERMVYSVWAVVTGCILLAAVMAAISYVWSFVFSIMDL